MHITKCISLMMAFSLKTVQGDAMEEIDNVLGHIHHTIPSSSSSQKQKSADANSRTLLSNLLDSIPDLVFFKDMDGVYMGCNSEFALFVGRPREEITGRTDRQLFPPDVADFFRVNDRAVMMQDAPRHNEEWITYADGRQVLVETLKAPLRDATGMVCGLLGVSRNITRRKMAEERAARQASVDSLLAAVSTRFIHLDPSGADTAIQDALAAIGTLEKADRAYVFRFSPDMSTCSNTHEWCAEGIQPQIGKLQKVRVSEISWWMERLQSCKSIVIPSVPNLPLDADTERRILEAQGIRSLLVMPMVWAGSLEGFIGFDSVRSTGEWNPEIATHLEMLSNIIINALKRKESEDRIKHAEEALKKSNERLQFALEGSEQGVWDWDIGKNEVVFSSTWKRMLGFEDHEIGNTLDEWEARVHSEDKEQVKNDLQAHLSGETPAYVSEHRMLCKDGSYKWILDKGKVLSRSLDGKPLRMTGTHADISDKKKTESVLREAMAIKSKFVSIASHELRSPLATMKAVIMMLAEEGTALDALEPLDLLSMLKRNIDRLLRLTTEILDFSKLEAGHMKYEFERINLNDVVQDSFSMMQNAALEKKVLFSLRLDPQVKETEADRDKMTQVLINLLNNALKFTAQGEVSVSTLFENDECKVTVADTGPGLTGQDLSRIFAPFAQLSERTTLGEKGTGLGLAISKEIVEAHGGRIWAESRDGSGASFSFAIPCKHL